MIGHGCALVLYGRVPRPGAVKTRMLPWLNTAEALALHLALLEDSIHLLKRAAEMAGALPVIAFSEPWDPEAGGEPLAQAAAGVTRLPQEGEDLGERLGNSCADLSQQGQRGVVIFGSDSPTLPPERLQLACERLSAGADLVLGPAEDGGYYLIGLRRAIPGLFTAIPWGTSGVWEATLKAARRAGLRPEILPSWYDVDRPADLVRLRDDLGRSADFEPAKTAAFIERLAREGRLPPPPSPRGRA